MTKIILVIIGILIAGASTIMTVFYGGDVYTRYYSEADAARMVSEASQIEAAMDIYYHQKNTFPSGSDPLQTLVEESYLTTTPEGYRNRPVGSQWVIDHNEGQIRSRLGPASDDRAIEMCRIARRQLNLTPANAVYQCDGSDSPDGRLNGLEPCCIRNPAP